MQRLFKLGPIWMSMVSGCHTKPWRRPGRGAAMSALGVACDLSDCACAGARLPEFYHEGSLLRAVRVAHRLGVDQPSRPIDSVSPLAAGILLAKGLHIFTVSTSDEFAEEWLKFLTWAAPDTEFLEPGR